MEEIDRTEILGKDMIVALHVWEAAEKHGELMYFSKLVKVLEGKISRVRINKALDRLFDQGILTGEWEKNEQKWIRSIKPANEARNFLKTIYEEVME